MNRKYVLEIMLPGATSGSDTWEVFESDTPFLPISRGELLNPGSWDDGIVPGTTILQVVNLEHIIWKSNDQIKHKIVVYTKEVEDNKVTRLSPP